MIDTVVWTLRVLVYLALAYGATRVWKYRPAKQTGASTWERVVAWRPHALYFGGWFVYLVYTLIMRRGLDIRQGLVPLGLIMLTAGLIELLVRASRRTTN